MESCVKRGILTKNSHTHQPLYGGSAERNKRIEKVRWCENERARAVFCSESPTVLLEYAKDRVIRPFPAP